MSMQSAILPLVGGTLIGLAVTAMLFFNGRVTGISGILDASLSKPVRGSLWRWLFLAGMLVGGALIQVFRPEYFLNVSGRSVGMVAIAGLLVGYGTVMGSGCTSGHGVCGISRLSVRSTIATVTFMLFGFLAVQIVGYLLGSST
jgi:uncharacterized membrane protein YedE/YeeE